MNKIKKGDSVIVVAGKDKGKKGEVIRLLDNNKCLVSAINMAKKHTKPNPNAGIEGGIIENPARTVEKVTGIPYMQFSQFYKEKPSLEKLGPGGIIRLKKRTGENTEGK